MTNKRMLRGTFIVAFIQNLAMTSAGGIFPVYLRTLGGTELLVGIAFAWFSLVRGFTSLVSGQIIDRLGRRSLLITSLVGFGAANLAYALAKSPVQLTAFRIVQGLAAGLYWVVILCMVADASSTEERLGNMTRFNIFIAISGIIANWMGGFLAEAFSPRLVFVQSCLMFAAATVFSLQFFHETDQQPGKAAVSKFSFAALLQVNSGVKRVSLLAGIGMIAETINLMGMSLYVYGIGGGYRDVGLIAGLIVASGLVCQLFAPALKRKLDSRGIILMVYLSNAIFLLLLFWRKTLTAAYLLFPVIGGLFALTSLTWLALAQDAAEEGQMGVATGFYRGTLDLTNVIYYLAFGALSARFSVAPLLAVAAFALLGLAFAAQRLLSQPGGEMDQAYSVSTKPSTPSVREH